MKLPALRLFAIRDLTTNKIIPGVFFGSKQEAKLERTRRGAETHVVTNGPDHRKFRA